MKIRLDIEGGSLTATLDDNETARDFAALLPLTLALSDYAATEKISDLPRKLSTKGAPSGAGAAVGDIAYYAPWGNLAIFYRSASYANGLVKLGHLDTDVEPLRQLGSQSMLVELLPGSVRPAGT